MEIKVSPLRLLDFGIINCSLNFIMPDDIDNLNVKELYSSYKIDFDYATIQDNESDFRVFLKVAINNDKNDLKAGYSVFAEGVSIFNLPKTVSKEDSMHLVNNAAVSMTIGYIRSFVTMLTSSSPMPKYILPAIDMQDLFVRKIQRLAEVKKQHDEQVAKNKKTKPK